MGFEPTRAEPIGLAVQRLNLSATVSRWLPSRLTIWFIIFQLSILGIMRAGTLGHFQNQSTQGVKISAELVLSYWSENFGTTTCLTHLLASSVASPKSVILTSKFLSSKMFCNLKSRWTKLLRWKNMRPSAIWETIRLTSLSTSPRNPPPCFRR